MERKIHELFDTDILDLAVKSFHIQTETLKKLGGFKSFIYEFKKGSKAYILRITHSSRRTLEMIEAEMEWINYLHDQGLNCSLPIKSSNSNYAVLIGVGTRQFIACAFDKCPGESLRRTVINSTFIANYGRLIGKMHYLTKTYIPTKAKRIDWYEDELLVNYDSILPENHESIKKAIIDNIQSIHAMDKHKDNYGLVHFDAHAGNFLIENNDLHIFDFDDSQYAFFVADIAIILFYYSMNCPSDQSKERFCRDFYEIFIKSYFKENQLNKAELSKIPLFLKQREFMLYLAILQAYEDQAFDNWAKSYMDGRKEKLEKHIPFLDMDFNIE